MAGALPTIDVSNVGGVKSLQELYNLISGTETSTSGGTTTTTESISQEGMNSMLQSALANTNGLAAVSSGQRSAGGYGSTVNQMLTNDLLTRTASQIAQSNKTTTQTKAPTTTTTGGITANGATKSLSFVAGMQGLQELDKVTGASKKIKDFFNKDSTASDTTSPTQAASEYSQGGPSTGVYGVSTDSTAGGGGNGSAETTFNFGDSGEGFDTSLMTEAVDTANSTDYSGGTTDELMFPEAFADGGQVSTKNRLNVLSTNQFNRVVDSRAGKIGGSSGENGPQQVSSNAQTQSVSTNSGGSGGGSSRATANDDGLGKFVNALASDDGQKFAKAVGVMGKLTGSPVLQQAGLVGGIATSSNPALAAGVTAADAVTGGAASKVLNLANTVKKPTIANTVDTALSFNPMTSGINGILKMLGFRTIGDTAGDITNNVELRSESRNHMTPEQQQAAKDWAAQQGQEVGTNEGVVVTPVEGPGTIETNDLGPLDEGGGSNFGGGGWSRPGDQGNGVTTSPVTQGSVSTTNLASGGEISGPGTGTSDSIPARLSDGETVITAATTAKVKEMFGEDFFHNLEKEFNAPAAARQMAKGRA